jgi:competence protein ComEC
LLASYVGFILRLVFPHKTALILLLFFLTGYFILLGNSPPVQRAWITISVFLVGMLTNLRCTPINALGFALIVEVLLYPPVITHIGFHLSFLCTWAILEVYPLMRKLLSRWLPIRAFDEVKKMDLWNQHGYIAASMIRESIALNFSVHLTALPALLCLFHKFPLLSIVYNLFFPIGASLVFLLMLVALCFSILFPFLGTFLSHLCTILTSGLLNLASHPPAIADIYIRVNSFPLSLVVIFLTVGVYVLFKSNATLKKPV